MTAFQKLRRLASQKIRIPGQFPYVVTQTNSHGGQIGKSAKVIKSHNDRAIEKTRQAVIRNLRLCGQSLSRPPVVDETPSDLTHNRVLHVRGMPLRTLAR